MQEENRHVPHTISVIVPAYNASGYIKRVIGPLLEMEAAGEVDEVLIIDDCSTDSTADIAKDMGATVLQTPQNGGPGAARNLAAEVAKGDILWLVDSDVIAALGGAALIRQAFSDTDVHAVFGSYDNQPDGQQLLSKYKNLTHRYHHQHAKRDARTFWAGCGAIRKDVYLEVGGFDVETYKVPSIEDIELGYRISGAGGRILVEPNLLGKHLKIWSFWNIVHTDIFRRAIPWARLMIAREGLVDDLNTGVMERVRAAIAGFFALSFLLMMLNLAVWPLFVVLLVLVFALNWDFFRFLNRNGGPVFAITSMLFHQLYYIYSAAAFVWCLFEVKVLGRTDLSVP